MELQTQTLGNILEEYWTGYGPRILVHPIGCQLSQPSPSCDSLRNAEFQMWDWVGNVARPPTRSQAWDVYLQTVCLLSFH